MNGLVFDSLLVMCIILAYGIAKLNLLYVKSSNIHLMVSCIIFFIFFICGMVTSTKKIFSFRKYFSFIFFSIVCTFLIYPMVGYVICYFLSLLNFNKNLLLGFMTVCFMPPPISAGVILTQNANGNESLAVIYSIVGNFIGIILSPLMLHIFLLHAVDIPRQGVLFTILHIVAIVIVPLIVGRSVFYISQNYLVKLSYKSFFSTANKFLLLGIIFLVFFDMFENQEWLSFGFTSALVLIISIMLCQSLMIAIIYMLGSFFLLNIADSSDMVAIIFSSSLKSLSTGMVIINSLLSNEGKSTSLTMYRTEITLPLMLFEPIQIFIGSLCQSFISQLVELFKRGKPQSLVLSYNNP